MSAYVGSSKNLKDLTPLLRVALSQKGGVSQAHAFTGVVRSLEGGVPLQGLLEIKDTHRPRALQ